MIGIRRAAGIGLVVVVALVLGACSALAPSADDRGGTTVESLESVNEAVLAADRAVVAVVEVSARINGLGRALYVRLALDGADVMAADELRTILEAIWTAVPFKPNAVRVVISRPGGVGAIDLTSAAEELMPGHWRPFGDGGVSLGGAGLVSALGQWSPRE